MWLSHLHFGWIEMTIPTFLYYHHFFWSYYKEIKLKYETENLSASLILEIVQYLSFLELNDLKPTTYLFLIKGLIFSIKHISGCKSCFMSLVQNSWGELKGIAIGTCTCFRQRGFTYESDNNWYIVFLSRWNVCKKI
jgi:hypothetical protein